MTNPNTEPPSGYTGAGTANQPYDQGNAPEQGSALPPRGDNEENVDPTSAHPAENPNLTATKPVHDDTAKAEAKHESKPIEYATDNKPQTLNNSATEDDPGNFEPAKTGTGKEASRLEKLHERDVSPGTLPDGSHAMTSGDRGMGYEPSAMSKLKNRLGMSGKK